MDYPEWYDVVWLAADRTGALAVFITAGYAPMPASVLACEDEVFNALETHLLSLPEDPAARDARGLFPEFSRRGIYAFDWSDIHGGRLNAYERVETPLTPITINDLPDEIREHYEMPVFDVEFKDMPILDVRIYLKCVEPADHPYQLDWAEKHPELAKKRPVQQTPVEQRDGLLVSTMKALKRAIRL